MTKNAHARALLLNYDHFLINAPQGATVIRVLVKQLLDEKSFKEGRRITLNEVSEETGISRSTLTRITNVPGNKTNTDSIDALCKYFECTPCELLKYIDE